MSRCRGREGRKGRTQGAYARVDEDETGGRSNGGSATKANCEPRRKREQAHITSEHTASQFALPRAGDGSLFPINSRLSSSILLILASQCHCSPPLFHYPTIVAWYRIAAIRRTIRHGSPRFIGLSVVVVSHAIAYIYAREHPCALLDRMRTRCADRNTHNAFARSIVLRFNAAATVDLTFSLFTSRCSHMCSDVGWDFLLVRRVQWKKTSACSRIE